MIRGSSVAVFAVLATASLASAQAPVRFRWQADQVGVYKVEQTTQVAETVGDATSETKTQMNLTKRWQVVAVGADGSATVQLSLMSLKFEIAAGNREALRFDSSAVEKSSPELKAQLSKFVGVPLAVLTLDSTGRVLEVKESKFGPATRFESELPFVGVMPFDALAVGKTWERQYRMTLEPPQGTGEKFAAVQHYTCKGISGNQATVALTTEVKAPPAAAADQVPLLSLQPVGQFVFDVANGRLVSAVLKVEKEIKGHQGEGSVYHYQSNYTEQYLGDR